MNQYISKHKRKFVPIIPATISEIEIIDDWKLCVELKPKYIMIDFERAVMNAFQHHFPLITIPTCMFRLT